MKESEWVYSGDKVKWSAIQVSQWRVSVVREQAWVGTLEGFHLKENVKYSLKQFNKIKDCKEPDLPPAKLTLTKLVSQLTQQQHCFHTVP